jgi:hypothetical protein
MCANELASESSEIQLLRCYTHRSAPNFGIAPQNNAADGLAHNAQMQPIG